MSELVIKDLHVSVEDKEILKGLDLTIKSKERHALMGPNGNGKSTAGPAARKKKSASVCANSRYIPPKRSTTDCARPVLRLLRKASARSNFFAARKWAGGS